MSRDYTYSAHIEQVKAITTGAYSAKGDAQESERLEVTVRYEGNSATDAFNVGGDHRDELIIGRAVSVILRITDTSDK